MRLLKIVFIGTAISVVPVLFGHGATDVLIHRLTDELAKQPEDAALYLKRAEAYLDHGDVAACVSDTESAERLQPGHALVGLLRGRALLHMKQPDAALAALDLALRAHPDHKALRLAAAQAAEQCGRLEEALSHQQAALSQMKAVEPEHLLTEVRLLCALHRGEEALKLIDTQAALPVLVQRAVEIELSYQRYDAALARIGAMIAKDPAPLPWMAQQASVLAQAGRLDESLRSWRAVQGGLRSLPPAVRSSYAMVLLLKQTLAAIPALEAALPPQNL